MAVSVFARSLHQRGQDYHFATMTDLIRFWMNPVACSVFYHMRKLPSFSFNITVALKVEIA